MNRQEVALDNFISRSESKAAAYAEILRVDEARVTGFVEFDIPVTLSPVTRRNDMADVAQWLQQPRRYSGSGVLLDNTTIVTLTSLLTGDDMLSPLTLWDLGRAITALVTYDNVFHFANSEVNDDALNAVLGQDVFRPLSLPDIGSVYHPPGVRGLFIQAWSDTDRVMERLRASVGTATLEGLEIEALTSQWSLALGSPLAPADVVNPLLSDLEWNSPGAALLAQLWRATTNYRLSNHGLPGKGLDDLGRRLDAVRRSPPVPEGLAEQKMKLISHTIREGNYRGHVNQRLACHLSLPYMPNMARIPFRSRFYDRALAVSDRLPSILALDTQYAERATHAQLLSGEPFVLPVFFVLAIRNAAVPQDLWTAVAALRVQARRYRERRADLDRGARPRRPRRHCRHMEGRPYRGCEANDASYRSRSVGR